MITTWHPKRALAALLLSVFAGVMLTASPAQAEGFCETDGVNVVVDFQDLGGGAQQECVPDGGGKLASEVFEEAGFELTPVRAFPGVACQVDELPAGVDCQQMPPGNAYWGLFSGADGTWEYASTGADELKLQDGDYVAFSWQTSETPALPRVAAAAGAEPTGAAVPPETDDQATDQTGDATTDQSGADAKDEESDGDALPIWVPILGVVALGAGVGAVMVTRRRREGE